MLVFFCQGRYSSLSPLFFFNDPPTTEIYTLSLHDALPICTSRMLMSGETVIGSRMTPLSNFFTRPTDRKSTRLNSSHRCISYAVFCLKKKKNKQIKKLI